MIEIKKASKFDIDSIVRIHNKAFPNFFLTKLGSGFLYLYYDSVLNHPNGIMLIGKKDSKIIGFCAGTLLSAGFNISLIKSNLIGYILRGLILFFSNPKGLWHLYKNMSKEDASHGDNGEYAELLSIGVDPNKQGGGVGSQMLAALEVEIKSKGGEKISLTTDYDKNEKAIGFYHSLGYEPWYDFITYPNRRMYRLIKKLK